MVEETAQSRLREAKTLEKMLAYLNLSETQRMERRQSYRNKLAFRLRERFLVEKEAA